MGKKIAFLATNGFEDSEFLYPYIRIKEAGHNPTIISLTKDSIKGKNGVPMNPDLEISEANPDDYDALILPGGANNPDHLRRHQNVLDFVAKINEQNKLIAAICHAGWVLISAGICEGKRVTSTPAIKDDMENAGAIWIDEAVVLDQNLVSSRRPIDLPIYMKTYIDLLKKHYQK